MEKANTFLQHSRSSTRILNVQKKDVRTWKVKVSLMLHGNPSTDQYYRKALEPLQREPAFRVISFVVGVVKSLASWRKLLLVRLWDGSREWVRVLAALPTSFLETLTPCWEPCCLVEGWRGVRRGEGWAEASSQSPELWQREKTVTMSSQKPPKTEEGTLSLVRWDCRRQHKVISMRREAKMLWAGKCKKRGERGGWGGFFFFICGDPG